MQFTEFPLHERLQRAITSANYQETTPIQAAAIPVGLAGADLVGTAQTGTGKTAAFVIPMLQRLVDNYSNIRKTRALIITPTRELAEQIHTAIQLLARHTNIRSATVYGGVSMMPQERALRNGTEIIVACPGRLLDHVQRGNTNFDNVDTLVLDEADRMLDMGFLPPITRIVGLLPVDRQTMLFSATFAPALNSFVDKHLQSPVRLAMDTVAPATTVEHALYPVPAHLKTALLKSLLNEQEVTSVLIFTRTKHRADRIAEQLSRSGIATGVLHSNKSQNQRQMALDHFRQGRSTCLVATDIAARGIDVEGISHVINYDVPDTAEAYIHRIGRTGRATHTGKALTLVTLEDTGAIRDIERELRSTLEKRYLDGFNYKESHTSPLSEKPMPGERPRTSRRSDVKPAKKRTDGAAQAKTAPRATKPFPAGNGPRPAHKKANHAGAPAAPASRRQKPRHGASESYGRSSR